MPIGSLLVTRDETSLLVLILLCVLHASRSSPWQGSQAVPVFRAPGIQREVLKPPSPQFPTILIVISRPSDFAERKAIRKTWGAEGRLHGVICLFVFPSLTKNYRFIQNMLNDEQKLNRDMLTIAFLPEEHDDDFGLTLNALDWATKQFPFAKYFGKATSDSWINMPKLAKKLNSLGDTKDFILGHYIDGDSEETRDLYGRRSKGHFAVGHLWVMPRQTIRKVLKVAILSPANSSISDNVITGEYRQMLKIKPTHLKDYVNTWDLTEPVCFRKDYTVVHGVFYNQKLEMHVDKENC